MATGYRKIAQAANVICDLCQRENDAEWKCLQCGEAMCNDCKMIHLRMKATRDHTVTTLRELMPPGQPQSRPATSGGKYCNLHKSEPLQMYCVEYHMVICLECLSNDHKRHEAVKISKMVEKKRQELSEIIAESKSKLTTYKDGLTAVQKHMDDYTKETRIAIDSVKKQRNKLKNKVDEEAENIIKEFLKEEEENKKRLDSVQKEYHSGVKRLEKFISDCEKKTSSASDISLVQTVEETKGKAHDYKSWLICPLTQASRFVAGKIDLANLKQAIGYIQRNEGQVVPLTTSDVKPLEAIKTATVIKSFISCVATSCVATVDNKHAWIGRRWYGDEEVLVSVDGKVKQRLELDFKLGDFAVTPGGELFVTDGSDKGSYIKRLTGGRFVNIADTSPFITHGIHATQDNDVLVCLYNTKSKQGKVTRMSITGQIKQQIQYDKENKALFTDPQLVSQNVNQDVCVIDWTNRSVLCTTLVVVDRDGQLRFR